MMWLSIADGARAMHCHRTTAYRRFRALERSLGRPVLVAKLQRGKEILSVRRADLQRALRHAGLEAESVEIAELKEMIHGLEESIAESMARLVKEVRQRRSV